MTREKQDFRHIAALDGVRGLAVILVFLQHAYYSSTTLSPITAPLTVVGELLQGIAIRGWIGVDLFFVLSGYLITSILLRAKDAENYYKVFYARRALRILPLYYLVVLAAMAVHWPPFNVQVWFWFNLSNFPTAFDTSLVPYLGQCWSLAIEEQFYLMWPTVVRRFNEKILIRICLGTIVGCFVLRNLPIVLEWNDRWPNFIYRLTPFRIDTLCAGALLAILMHRGVNLNRFRDYFRIAFVAGVAILAISHSGNAKFNVPGRFAYTGTLLCFTALIALALDPASRTAKIFRNSFLRRMGLYSYCFYLIHVGILRHEWILYPRLRSRMVFANDGLVKMLVHCIAFAVTFGICAVRISSSSLPFSI